METAQSTQVGRDLGASIAIFVATRAEAKPLYRAMGATHQWPYRSDSTSWVGQDGRTLLIARTGMGPEHAEIAARRLFSEVRVAAALSVGVAAGLSPEALPGDLIVGNRVVFHRQSGTAPRSYPCDPTLVDLVLAIIRRAGDRHDLGSILTVERLVPTAKEKRRLATESGALAVDMESGAIAAAAAAQGIPFLAIRVILDPVDKDLTIAFDEFLSSKGESRPVPLIRYLLGHPLALPHLLGLGIRTKAACARLGGLLRQLSTG